MTSVNSNAFQQTIQKHVNDPSLRFVFGVLFEAIIEQQRQIDSCIEILTSQAKALDGFVHLDGEMMSTIKGIQEAMKEKGISVESQSIHDEPSR